MVTYKKIITAAQGMRKISSMDIRVREAMALSKLIKKLDEEARNYYEQRDRLCKKYGKLEEGKDAYFIPEENRGKISSELKELDELEVDMGGKIKITADEKMKIDSATLLATEDFVEFIFEEEEENGE